MNHLTSELTMHKHNENQERELKLDMNLLMQ